jgi:hypothetical protein
MPACGLWLWLPAPFPHASSAGPAFCTICKLQGSQRTNAHPVPCACAQAQSQLATAGRGAPTALARTCVICDGVLCPPGVVLLRAADIADSGSSACAVLVPAGHNYSCVGMADCTLYHILSTLSRGLLRLLLVAGAELWKKALLVGFQQSIEHAPAPGCRQRNIHATAYRSTFSSSAPDAVLPLRTVHHHRTYWGAWGDCFQ